MRMIAITKSFSEFLRGERGVKGEKHADEEIENRKWGICDDLRGMKKFCWELRSLEAKA
jgi:hypothetical protein